MLADEAAEPLAATSNAFSCLAVKKKTLCRDCRIPGRLQAAGTQRYTVNRTTDGVPWRACACGSSLELQPVYSQSKCQPFTRTLGKPRTNNEFLTTCRCSQTSALAPKFLPLGCHARARTAAAPLAAELASNAGCQGTSTADCTADSAAHCAGNAQSLATRRKCSINAGKSAKCV